VDERADGLADLGVVLADVWGPGYDATGNLRVYMAQLRRKLEPDPARPHWLLTEPGMGYRYQPGPDKRQSDQNRGGPDKRGSDPNRLREHLSIRDAHSSRMTCICGALPAKRRKTQITLFGATPAADGGARVAAHSGGSGRTEGTERS